MDNPTLVAPAPSASTWLADCVAGVVVFFVALPLCLGIALASGAPLFSGLVAGVVGGVLVGVLSGSHTSVSGPAAGLTAVVLAEIARLGSFEALLVALTLAGVLQAVLGLCRAGFLAEFLPSAVVNGLLAAIGVILILKQLPHLIGDDRDPEGDMAFLQPDHETTFTELTNLVVNFRPGVAVVGFACLGLLMLWDRSSKLKRLPVPSSLVAVGLGVGLAAWLETLGAPWRITPKHMVAVPVAGSLQELAGFFAYPDWSVVTRPAVALSAVTIALVASLETLLNIEAVDRIDPQRRKTPPSRELVAQGFGNVACGLLGGLPVTSVIIRSSVNLSAGAQSKRSTIAHGLLLAAAVAMAPQLLNRIPLAALAAILLVTGFKLTSPKVYRRMWVRGWSQFFPFLATVVSIVLTDLLIGVLIGLGVSVLFILYGSVRRPVSQTVEHHVAGDVLRIELPEDVSFLNRVSLARTLSEAPRGGTVVIDATKTRYMDPDVVDLIADYRDNTAAAHGVRLSLEGFRDKYAIDDRIDYIDYTSREVQANLQPRRALDLLQQGNERFRTGKPIKRDFTRLIGATAEGQFPMAVMLSCIDSRVPAELVFDLGLGDIFIVRIAGNVAKAKVLGSIEYACLVAGAKLVVVMGHTRCGAVTTAFDLALSGGRARDLTGCEHLDLLIDEIKLSMAEVRVPPGGPVNEKQKRALVDKLAEANVLHTIRVVRQESRSLADLEARGQIMVVGALYEVETGEVHWMELAPEA
jgi:carbonic anhydrase/SulP family sulfate permease